jgi:hypothetical protein
MEVIIKLVGICLAIVALCVVTATEASAAEDIYKIEGVKLEAGEARSISANAKTEFTFKAKGALEVEAVTKCRGLELKESASPEIFGGLPGTAVHEVIEFEECSATVGGAKCESAEITSATMNGELVTVRAPNGLSGHLATLLRPASGTEVAKVKLNKCGIFGTQSATVEGTTAAATSPEGVFEPEGTLAWKEGSEEITEIEKANGTKERVELKSSGKKASLNGEAQLEQNGRGVSVKLISGERNFKKRPINVAVFEKFIFENIAKVNYESVVIKPLPGKGNAFREAKATTCAGVVAAKSRCEVEIEFEPTKSGMEYESTLNIAYNDGQASNIKRKLEGRGK